MPFKSEAQRKYLWANEPEIARDWTDTYGSRIQKEDGGLTHNFENYAYDDGGNVSVPRSFQARAGSDPVNLAYVTPQEEGILQSLKPGTPHRGPMEIPNYDSFDAAGNYTSGAAMSAAETGSRNQRDRAEVRASNIGGPKGLAPGVTSNQAQELRNSFLNARAMGQRSGGNFFGNIARGVGSIFGGLPGQISSFASRLDPRKLRMVNGKMMPQSYFSEEEREKRRNERSINTILNRDAPITDLTHKRLGQLGYEGTMPAIDSTRTSRAIDKDYDINEAISEYPITSNRIQDIQRGWDKQETSTYDDLNAIEGDLAKVMGPALIQMRVLEKKKGMSEHGGPVLTPDEERKLDKLKEMDKEETIYRKAIAAHGGFIDGPLMGRSRDI